MTENGQRELSAEDLQQAALLRFAEGLTWDRIAGRLNCSVKTLFRHRTHEDGRWAKAKEGVLKQLRDDGLEEAWGCLVRNAHRNDTAAAKELLARIEGCVKQMHELTGPDGGALTVNIVQLSPDDKGGGAREPNGGMKIAEDTEPEGGL